MTEANILTVGDVHLAERPPGRRDEHYYDDCLRKLDQIVKLSHIADAVVFIGDLFHHKRANHVTHRLVLDLAERLARMGDVYVVAGNHDLADGSLSSLTRQPISALGLLDNVTILAGEPGDTVDIGGFVCAWVPGTGEVCDAKPEALSWFEARADVIFAHAPVSAETKPWACWHPDELPFDGSAIVYGHQHDRARVVREPGYDTDTQWPGVFATGAVMRGAISEASNEPAVCWLNIVDNPVDVNLAPSVAWKVAPLDCRPAAEVYRWAELADEKHENASMDAFVAALGTEQLVGFSREGLVGQIRERQDLDDAVRAEAIEILETV